MSGREEALEKALLQRLAADSAVQLALGLPLRVVNQTSPRPILPYLEIARHLSEPREAAGVAASLHAIDLAVVSREEAGAEARRAIAAVRTCLAGGGPPMTGWLCALLVPGFTDVFRERIGQWRAVLRVRAVIEPA